ncbi:MAG TPA: hypothetical protein VFZ34_25855 [Blastocatellia bacterium]|nr:hypothetical protein [Blastocatellia bacterium]
MFRKPIVHILAGALFLSFVGVPSVTAKTKEEKAAEFAAKVKREVAKLGTGPDAQISVKLRDKTKLSGFVSKIGEESFFVTEANTGATTEVPYPNVTQVKGNNLNAGVIVALSVGITLAVLFILAYALRD